MFKINKDGFLPTIRRYNGKLVFQCSDDFSEIEVVDYAGDRSLHFGSPEKQSAMNMKKPYMLVLSYTKAMMAGLLFMGSPRSVLNLGLGGGSLPKFLLHHFPDCKIDIVELRPMVVQIAFDHFSLPKDPRLRIFINDAQDFLKQEITQCYDLILLDIFNKRGMVDLIGKSSFLQSCKNRLTEKGILVVNLWSKPDSSFKTILTEINKVFDSQTLHLPVADRSNHIVFAMNHTLDRYPRSMIQKAAQRLNYTYKIDLPNLFLKIYTHKTGQDDKKADH